MINKKIIYLSVFIFILLSSVASASSFNAKPGMRIPLEMKQLTITTDKTILPDWTPQYAQYELYNPIGDKVFVKDKRLMSVTKEESRLLGSTEWTITDSAGTVEIPAFAETGNWQLKVKIHDEGNILFGENAKQYSLRTIYISDATFSEDLLAPLHFTFSVPAIGDICLSTPDIIYVVFIILLLIIAVIYFLVPNKKK